MEDQLTVTIPEAGRMLGCGRTLAYRLSKNGKLPIIALGRKRLVSLPALRQMLQDVGSSEGSSR